VKQLTQNLDTQSFSPVTWTQTWLVVARDEHKLQLQGKLSKHPSLVTSRNDVNLKWSMAKKMWSK